jgi:pilus assembly protein CpaC
MATRTLIRTASLAALTISAWLAPMIPATAADPRHVPAIQVAASEATSRFIPLGIGKSVAIDLPADIKDVLVADPKIANAVIRSSRRAYMIGVTVGQTNIFFFDADGRQIAGFDIAVTRDLNGVRAALKRTMPDADIRIEGVADGIMLSGSAASAAEAQQAYDLASRLAGDGAKVVNGITVQGRDQVMLKVTVAEVQRDVIKQLGINITGSAAFGSAIVNFNSNGGSGNNGTINNIHAGGFGLGKSMTATLQALDNASVAHILAEPTLSAISGETATFLAGGKFPVPIAQPGNPPTYTIQWQTFGVSLKFTPVVMSEGRISLKVLTEVSELSEVGAVDINGTHIPAIRTRNVDTTVEIPSGGSLAMAGMIQEQTKQNIDGMPGLMNVPILGALFKSRNYNNGQTELMVIVTPYIVRAVARKDLSRPDDGFSDPSDPQTVLLGRFNRIYGVLASPPNGTYRGKYGFILD